MCSSDLTASSSTAEFEADILILDDNSGLKIGMNADATIITQQKDNVFAVSYDMISSDAQGNEIIFTAKPAKEGKYTAQAVPVKPGIETDSQIEISGDGLKDGLLIIADSKNIIDGMPVKINKPSAADPQQNAQKAPSAEGGEK